MFNGGLATLGAMVNWAVLFGIAGAVALVWLARLEIDETDRRGAKPNLIRH